MAKIDFTKIAGAAPASFGEMKSDSRFAGKDTPFGSNGLNKDYTYLVIGANMAQSVLTAAQKAAGQKEATAYPAVDVLRINTITNTVTKATLSCSVFNRRMRLADGSTRQKVDISKLVPNYADFGIITLAEMFCKSGNVIVFEDETIAKTDLSVDNESNKERLQAFFTHREPTAAEKALYEGFKG